MGSNILRFCASHYHVAYKFIAECFYMLGSFWLCFTLGNLNLERRRAKYVRGAP